MFSSTPPYLRVIVLAAAAFQQPFFHYLNPGKIEIGQLIKVPFGSQSFLGLVIGFDKETEFAVKPILEILSVYLPLSLTESISEIAVYYFSSPAQVLKTALPKMIRQLKFPEISEKWVRLLDFNFIPRKGSKQLAVLEILKKEEKKLTDLKKEFSTSVLNNLQKKKIIEIFNKNPEKTKFILPKFSELTKEQKIALQQIRESEKPSLLYGVTGSGKTEIYLHLTAEAISQDKSVLILIPEIALTPQLIDRFEEYFSGLVAVFHSKKAAGERARAWMEVNRGYKKIIIGPRSAIFAPTTNLGLIILDEYHDWSFKQDNKPFYDTRWVAKLLAQKTNATLIFGSATPRIEDFGC